MFFFLSRTLGFFAAPSRSMRRLNALPRPRRSRAATPNARIDFSGGTGLLLDAPLEAPIAMREFEALGIAHDRITAEEQSRNTHRECRVLAPHCPAEAGRALAVGDFGLSHAARHRGIPRRRFSHRRSIGVRAGRSTRRRRLLCSRRASS